MNTLRLLLLVTIFGVSSSADSSVLIEPLGNLKVGRSSQGPTSGSVLGLGLGARIGIEFFGDLIFVAADGRMGLSSFKASGGSASTSLNHIQVGALAGVSIPSTPFRVWLGYNFLEKLSGDVDQLGTPVDSTYTGTSFKLGSSYEITPLFALNAELEFQKFKDLEQNGSSVELNPRLSTVVLVLSLSMPFGL